MNEGIFNFQFNGVNIPFKANLGNTFIMINATEMAKSVCKTKEEYLRLRPAMWIRSKDCKDYLNAIVNVRKVHIEDLIITSKGGSKFGQRDGTWMEKHLAIRYAQKLMPEFAVWVDDRIDEILTSGYSYMTQENGNLQNIINQLQNDNSMLQSQLTAQQPAMNYYNRVLSQNNGYTTREICAQLGLRISNKKLIQMLVDGGYMFRDKSGKPYLKDPWSKQGFQATVYEPCSDGVVRPFLKWTEIGKQFILERALDWKLI